MRHRVCSSDPLRLRPCYGCWNTRVSGCGRENTQEFPVDCLRHQRLCLVGGSGGVYSVCYPRNAAALLCDHGGATGVTDRYDQVLRKPSATVGGRVIGYVAPLCGREFDVHERHSGAHAVQTSVHIEAFLNEGRRQLADWVLVCLVIQ